MSGLKNVGIAVFLLLSVSGEVFASRDPLDKPNVIWIVADDLGYADLSVQGAKDITTPNIDSVAKNGARFSNGYVTAPICGPSRVGILTGRYQDRIGFSTNHGPQIPDNYGLPKDTVLLPTVLKKSGYRTGMVGKWHLGFKDYQLPTQTGFDYFFGFLHGYHSYKPGSSHPGPLYENDKETTSDVHLTEKFADKAVEFIKENRDNPFFLYLPFNAIHGPFEPEKSSVNKFKHIKNPQRRKILALVSELDTAVGKVSQSIDSLGLKRNTVIIFLSDNGGIAGPNSPGNGNLRRGKGTLYEGGIRVPFFVSWPGQISENIIIEEPVISLDVFPTVLNMADSQTSGVLEGKDLMTMLKKSEENGAETSRTLFWRYIADEDQKAVRKGDWKLVQNAPDAPVELYNLASDIGERKNLAVENPKIARELLSEWKSWESKNINPLWMDKRIQRKNSDSSD